MIIVANVILHRSAMMTLFTMLLTTLKEQMFVNVLHLLNTCTLPGLQFYIWTVNQKFDNMKKNTIVALLSLFAVSCTQQQASHATDSSRNNSNSISLESLAPVADGNKFPLVHFPGNKHTEDKINTFLQLEQLEHLPGVYEGNPFEHITYGHDGGAGGSVNFSDYAANPSIPNILSLTFSGESTGAYSENFDAYYNFDLRTGNKIMMQDLFTKEGAHELTQLLNQHVKKEIEDYIATLRKPAGAQNPAMDDSEALDDEAGMYEECLGNVMEYQMAYYTFFFRNDSITFERERCSNHAMRALDELDRFYITVAFKDLKPYLSPYGKSLLNNSMENMQTTSPEGKIYKGRINDKYPIHAMISKIEEDGSCSMLYWYDKTKIPIEWHGAFKANHFSLTETDAHNGVTKETAKIEADWTGGGKISGTWKNSKTSESLKLELQAH